MRRLVLGLLAAAALGASGCGGTEQAGSLPAGASVVPADAPAFISLATDFDSQQLQQARTLLAKFPGSARLLRMFEQEVGVDFQSDVKPALGPEVDVVWLDFDNGGNNVVGLTQPKDEAKFKALLEKGDASDPSGPPTVTDTVAGWTVVADSRAKIDAFKRAASGDKLADVEDFKSELGRLPDAAVAKVYVDGRAVQGQLDRSVGSSGGASGFRSRDFFTLGPLGAAAVARDDGVRAEAHAALRLTGNQPPFAARLPDDLPAGALLYVAFSHLDNPIRQALKAVARNNPSFRQQRSTVEGVLGISLERDVLPQFTGESAFAIYPALPLPTFEFVQTLTNEDKARALLARIGPIAEAGGGVHVRRVRIGAAVAYRLPVPGQSFSIYYGVVDGKLVIANSRAAFSGLLSSGPKLSDDAAYRAARDGAEAPDEATGFVYANLERGLPLAFRFAEGSGSDVPAEARVNTRPLRSTLLSFSSDGDRFDLSAFLGIK